MGNPIISVQDVVKKYDGRDAVIDGVSFSIDQGEFAVIFGKSGCGKTTLLNMIGGLDRPTSGRLILDGVDIASAPEEKLAAIRMDKVGFVFQDFNLLTDLTVRENIQLPLRISGRLDNKRVETLVDMFDLSHVASEKANTISGGEAQRTAVARALANSPRVILADEPTGNLDDENTIRVIEMFEMARGQFDATIILATHDRDLAANSTVKILLEYGKIRTERSDRR